MSASSGPRAWWSKAWVRAMILVIGTVLVYLPLRGAGFIWDDDEYVTENSLLHSLTGLGRIWLAPGATPQYYPLTFTVFWIGYHLWGLNPLGFHVLNVLLHALNAVLLWRLLERLGARGAWLAAAIFAVHPVCVESAAWITELKNTLSLFFFLLCGLACVKFWQLGDAAARAANERSGSTRGERDWRIYCLALGLYVCALLCKTAVVGLPMAILLLIWWKRGWPRPSDLLSLLPFLAAGAGMGLITMFVERQSMNATGDGWQLSWLQRCLLAGRAFWFYLGKLIWPHPLIFNYPHWRLDAGRPGAYAPVLAMLSAPLALWPWRNKWGRPVLFVMGCFFVMLFPVLGFLNVFYFRYSYVSDHFQYAACIGPLSLAAAGLATIATRLGKRKPALEFPLCGALLAVLGTLTWQQCGNYAGVETLWRATLKDNPGAWLAENNLGEKLFQKGLLEEARPHFEKAVELCPDFAEAWNNLGQVSADAGRMDEAAREYAIALRLQPRNAEIRNNAGVTLARAGRLDEAIQQFRAATNLAPADARGYANLANALSSKGQIEEAIPYFRKAIELKFEYPEAHFNFGNALAAKADLNQAVAEYELAIRLKPGYAQACYGLGTALARAGRFQDAVGPLTDALRAQPQMPELHYNLGFVLAQLGRHDEAVGQLREALRLKGDYDDAKRLLRDLDEPAAATKAGK